MADYCSIQESLKHQMLTKMSGVSKNLITSICGEYLDRFGRYPELDEIPNVDSSEYLKEEFDLKTTKSGTNYQSTENILDITGTETILDANAQINDNHKDLEVKITDVDGTSIFEIEHRPSEYNIGKNTYNINAASLVLKSAALVEALNRMRNLYGIKIIPITNYDEFPPELNVSLAKAFIYNGNIYVNTDLVTPDSPIHEMLHILIGGMSVSNPQLFYELISSVEQIPNFEERMLYYPNRTRSDLDEEIFVEELGKYLTGLSSLISTLNPNIINLILYYIQRDLDTILKGNYSVKSIDDIFNYSLMELAELAESNSFNMTHGGILTDATIHRMLANTKEKYIKNGDLTENCE